MSSKALATDAELASPVHSASRFNDCPPPQYFYSEPTSQPPAYFATDKNNRDNDQKSEWTSEPNEQNQQRKSNHSSGLAPASASRVAAILGPPPPTKTKMTLRERWKEIRHGDGYTGADAMDRSMGGWGSRTTWNVQNAGFLPKERRKG